MDKTQLINAIEEARKRHTYASWTIGITNDPNRARANVSMWKDWKADSEKIAREVEQYFQAKGMKGGGGGGENPTYVYIF